MLTRIACLLAMFVVTGCFQSPTTAPAFAPPRATVEIYATSPQPTPNTKPAVDLSSGAAIYLVTPPIVSTSDIEGVAKTESTHGTVRGSGDSLTESTLHVRLNENGARNMLAATTNPKSPVLAFVVNGTVISTPKISDPISKSFRINGDGNDPTYANAVAAVVGAAN